ncbi:AfsR/SARP family transcriptional regulator [Amycolatopsis sp. 195334CR]|uniref:AfsR/SARP family transcriptional regulator n=1 Tax=Amycolatopsis sp. 195334CR TaxID=2814588 RepID=UPI001A903D3A|nr:AfsR/SARP family transcriptional regulator [Amycolatopsis sp. 195334CR]MBN6039813.1 winged helix-turn-helix domain-containing protein [Amycolatopsis sp. 195334CR]
MEFEVLGSVRLREAVPTGRLRRTLLGVLLANANRVVPSSVLTDAMWGDQRDDRVVRNLHTHVHRLRGVLGEPGRLRSEPEGYLLTVLPGELDAERFEALIEDGIRTSAHDPGRGAELIRKGLAIWRGAPFGGLDVPVLHDEARRLGEQRLLATEELYTAELAAGRHTAVITELTELVARYPLRERLHGLLMTALYRGGQQAGALAAYRTARAVLVEELGQEPGPELRQLERRILTGEPIETARVVAVPAQLPHDVRGFVGREDQLAELDELEPGEIVAVVGEGGVGKTALAVRWAHRARERFPDGQLYVDLRGYGPEEPVPPGDVLAAFLRELGLDNAAIPDDVSERAARLRSLVDGRRLLIVLDNARTVEQVRPLLPGGSSCAVLVTSRDALAGLVAREGAHRIRLGHLSHDEAVALLRELVGPRIEEVVPALTECCARLPLALRLAAETINARPGWDLDDLLTELTTAPLDVLDAGGDEETGLRAVFSWSYRCLPPEARRLFRVFGLRRSREVELHALAGAGYRATRSLFDALLRAHLVEEVAPGRYRLHELLFAYAKDLVEATDERAAPGRLIDRHPTAEVLPLARTAAIRRREKTRTRARLA